MKNFVLLATLLLSRVGADDSTLAQLFTDLFAEDTGPVYVQYTTYTSSAADLSSEAAAAAFQQVYLKNLATGVSNTKLNTYTQTTNGVTTTMTVEFSQTAGGSEVFQAVVAPQGSATAATDLVVYKYKCKDFPVQKAFLCLPYDCDEDLVIDPPPPSHQCDDNYYLSQKLVKYTFYGLKSITATQTVATCYRQKAESIGLGVYDECFAVGLKPDNMLSLDDLGQRLVAAGYTKNSDGTFTRLTTTTSSSSSSDPSTDAASGSS